MLVRQHGEAAFRLAFLFLGSAAEAEDVAQEAFIRALHALDRFDLARPFRPWLLSITANLARNRRRSIGRSFAALRRWVEARPESELAVVDDTGPDALQAKRLWQAIRRLNRIDQEIIYLRYFLELGEAEAAAALAIPAGTCKSRLHRALSRLKVLVEQEFPDLKESYEDGPAAISQQG
jgi:RNA polymerase sigma-70 factor (ECF subfamily)